MKKLEIKALSMIGVTMVIIVGIIYVLLNLEIMIKNPNLTLIAILGLLVIYSIIVSALNDKPKKEKIFTSEFLKEIGFTLVHETKSEYSPFMYYGRAKDRTGMTHILWNEIEKNL